MHSGSQEGACTAGAKRAHAQREPRGCMHSGSQEGACTAGDSMAVVLDRGARAQALPFPWFHQKGRKILPRRNVPCYTKTIPQPHHVSPCWYHDSPCWYHVGTMVGRPEYGRSTHPTPWVC
eukprot:gene17513-biopygen8337